MVDYSEQRKHMVEGHLRPSGVRDPIVLNVVGQIPRENFLPDHLKSMAYVDDDIKLDNHHFMLRPNDLLLMILALRIVPSDKVLDVGCTTGYSSIILSFLGHKVVGLEEINTFLEDARAMASLEGVKNVSFVSGPYVDGYASEAPYNAILLQRACPEPAQSLLDQLVPGGRLVYIII
jgi:protein-L-isoaspartate(D-aspartate) O-methyltransferase